MSYDTANYATLSPEGKVRWNRNANNLKDGESFPPVSIDGKFYALGQLEVCVLDYVERNTPEEIA
jgi:hypothetical protein